MATHGSVVLTWGGKTIYVDPYGGAAAYAGLAAPDVVLITDIHGDHLDPATLAGRVCQNMEFFGLAIDEDKNQERRPGLRELNRPEGRVKILVIPTAEELEIARQCADLLGRQGDC